MYQPAWAHVLDLVMLHRGAKPLADAEIFLDIRHG
jgi:hypothetical protein